MMFEFDGLFLNFDSALFRRSTKFITDCHGWMCFYFNGSKHHPHFGLHQSFEASWVLNSNLEFIASKQMSH